MQFLLDECSGDRQLWGTLLAQGHDVVRSLDKIGGGVEDADILNYACEHDRVVIAYKNLDFALLAEEMPDHPGLILISQGEPHGDMTIADIAQALDNVVERHAGGLAGRTIVLNSYR